MQAKTQSQAGHEMESILRCLHPNRQAVNRPIKEVTQLDVEKTERKKKTWRGTFVSLWDADSTFKSRLKTRTFEKVKSIDLSRSLTAAMTHDRCCRDFVFVNVLPFISLLQLLNYLVYLRTYVQMFVLVFFYIFPSI